MAEVLFEITKDNLETGMRGYPVGYCTTSTVDPQKGLSYMEIPVDQMTDWEPEEVIYLLYYGHKGSPEDIQTFKKELQKRSKCSKELIKQIKLLPQKGHPMKHFCIAILLAGMLEGTGNYREDCLNLIAKLPEITAAVINHHAGWGNSETSVPEAGYIENFTFMLNPPNGNRDEFTHIMKLFAILHFDHGGGNLSTFVGKAVASGLEDLYGSISAAMAALAGPRHGRANQDCLEFVKEIQQQLGDNPTAEEIGRYIRKKLDNNELIYGFGHAVLRVEDPRAAIFYKIADENYSDHPLVKIITLLRKEVPPILKENPKISSPYPNVDATSGTLLTVAGFPYEEYYTLFFGMARSVGIACQIVYERCEAREGKGTPIVRPKYLFKAREQKKP